MPNAYETAIAEVSVHLLTALMSSAITILVSKLNWHAVCARRSVRMRMRVRCPSHFLYPAKAIFSTLQRSEQMNLLPRLWTTSQELTSDPLRAMRREMENALRAFDQNWPSADIGAGAPAINVAETKDAYEVTAELPGVDEKDIKVSLDDNQLVISGEKKAESKKEEKDWHVEERSYGSFYRSISLPFEPEDGAVALISTRAYCISRSRSPRRP